MGDFAYLLAMIPNIAWWAIPLLLLIVFFKAPFFKGLAGKSRSEDESAMIAEPPIEMHAGQACSAVQAKVSSRVASMVEAKLCPRCGSPMVLRISKKGNQAGRQFWGCSTFPKCRGIIDAS